MSERECILCGASQYVDARYGCAHVSRADIRERLRGGIEVTQTTPNGEHRWYAWNSPGRLERSHPTRPGAIDLVLDALVEREVERLRNPEPAAGAPESCKCVHEPKPFAVGDIVVLTEAGFEGETVELHSERNPEPEAVWYVGAFRDNAPGKCAFRASDMRHATPAERAEYEPKIARLAWDPACLRNALVGSLHKIPGYGTMVVMSKSNGLVRLAGHGRQLDIAP